jgi:hypothetical protein
MHPSDGETPAPAEPSQDPERESSRWPVYVIAMGGVLTLAWIILLMWAAAWLFGVG